jgi:hypothetical protein
MKLITSILVFGLIGGWSIGQVNRTEAYFKSTNRCDLYCKLSQVAGRFDAVFSKQFIHSSAFVMFTVDSLGNVGGIQYYEGTPQYISDYIKDALFATNGEWMPAIQDGRPVKSKPFLLPIIFEFEKGTRSEALQTVQNDVTLGSIMWMTYFEKIDTSSPGRYYARPRSQPIDCILLSPLRLESIGPIH